MSAWETPGASDEWYTPKKVFDALGCRFDLDVAASLGFTHVPTDWSIHTNSLSERWNGFVWMNPPFGGRNGLQPWLEKFFRHGNGIALTPDRTSTPWFRFAWSQADLVLFTPKLRFINGDPTSDNYMKEGKSPSNGTALWAAGEQGCEALRRAHAAGLGILGRPVAVETIRSTT